MIQSFTSRTNMPIFTWNEKHLCSRVDPVAEAKEWVCKYKNQIQSCSEVIVLGLGCGYHILEVIKEFSGKKVTVIESQPEIISWFGRYYPMESASFKCLVIRAEEELLKSSAIQSSIKQFYTVLAHRPSLEIFPELKIYHRWLLGRTYDSLSWITQLRSEKSLYDWQSRSLYDLNKDGLTIMDLEFKDESGRANCLSDIQQKILALRELIA